MSEKSWADGLASGAFKNRGSHRWDRGKRKGRGTRIGVRKVRMAKRRRGST